MWTERKQTARPSAKAEDTHYGANRKPTLFERLTLSRGTKRCVADRWPSIHVPRSRYNQAAMKNTVDAKCCAAAESGGPAHRSTLQGHHPQKLQCVRCGKEYSVDYNPADRDRVADFDKRLIDTAQEAINGDHSRDVPHRNFIHLYEI